MEGAGEGAGTQDESQGSRPLRFGKGNNKGNYSYINYIFKKSYRSEQARIASTCA
jgi:hypothetical protein